MAGSKYPIMRDRKDLAMRNQRSFSLEFKRRVIEEILSGESRPAQLCRRYNISPSLLYHWKKQYSRGKYSLPMSLLKLTATHIQEATKRLSSAVSITPAISNERTEISIAT
ncbi:MAG: transposase [Dehalococcoidales bacterium]